jgi:protein-disulfide isomerase
MVFCFLCQPAVDARADSPELPGVNTADLDEDERKLLLDIIQAQFDPCGKDRSLLESVQASDTCPLAPRLTTFAVGMVVRGHSKRQILRALSQELQRLTARHTFNLEGRPSFGPANARVTIVEFYDFQCPHCRLAAARTKELLSEHPNLRLVHKQYPLSFHPHARTAAIAALAAHRQGKFRQFHDQLFEAQETLDAAVIERLVGTLELDMARFERDKAAAERILNEDKQEGDSANIEGTPSFFVNGLYVDYEGLEEAVEKALEE